MSFVSEQHYTKVEQPTQSTGTDMSCVQTDIIIVGAGPIGLTMCRALAGLGLKVHLIEKQPHTAIANPKHDGREIAITHRTKAMMQQLGQWQLLDSGNIHFLKHAEVLDGSSPFALQFEKPDSVNGKPIETLGYLLSNKYIRESAYQTLASERDNPSYLTADFAASITDVQTNDVYAQVTLSSGKRIQGSLLLAADSRISFMRKKLGISADMHEFGRTVLLYRCTHTFSNNQTAHEAFYYGKTLAVLPLGEYESSLVITMDTVQAAELKTLDKHELASLVSEWLGFRLGEITITSELHEYPLVGVHARKFYAKRSALIGDAAVGMHPVTAHGYNLGMESVEILTSLIKEALASGQDIASPALLQSYHRKHSVKTRALYHGTNAIVKLYTNDSPPARVLRSAGLRVSNQLAPLKKLITAQLTG